MQRNTSGAGGALSCAALCGPIAAAVILSLSAVAQAADPPRMGTATIAAYKFVPSLDAVPQRPAVQRSIQEKPVPFRTPIDPLTFQEMKAQAAVPRPGMVQGTRWNSQPPAPMGSAMNKATGRETVSPTEITFNGISSVSCAAVNGGIVLSPSMMALAVGDTNVGVMQAVNNCFSVFDKSGNQQAGYPKSTPAFFGVVNAFDPRLLYDWINHRYLFLVVSVPNGCGQGCPSPAFYELAVSTSDNPTGSWCLLQIFTAAPQNGTGANSFALPDFPRLGQNRDAVFLAANDFQNGGYIGDEVIALPKGLGGTSGATGVYSACGTSFAVPSRSHLTNGFNIQPATNFSPYDDPKTMYFVTSDVPNAPSSQLVLSSWHDPFNIDGESSFNQIRIAATNTYSMPPNALQCGGTTVGTLDTRISATAMYVGGSIYASLTTADPLGGARSAIISYQIQPFVSTSGMVTGGRVLNEIVHRGGPGQNWYFPAQQPDPEGNVTTVFGYSDSTTCPSVGYVSRRAAQTPSTDPDNGAFASTGTGPTSGPWGYYFATAPAGMVSGGGTGGFPKMWFAGQYGSTNPSQWNTSISRTGYDQINQNIPTQTGTR